jgi:hypothetical protein
MAQRWILEVKEAACGHLRWGPLCGGAEDEPGQREELSYQGAAKHQQKATARGRGKEPALTFCPKSQQVRATAYLLLLSLLF